MLVSTTGSSQLVHGEERGRGLRTHLYSQVTTQGRKMEWRTKRKRTKNTKEFTIRRPAQPAAWSRIQTPHTQTKNTKKKKKKELKKNISKSTTLSFFLFLYPTSSSIATLIVQQDQYIFYNHFKVPLIFFWVFTTVQAKHTLQSAQI